MLRVLALILFFISLLNVSCSEDVFESRPSDGELEFSKDTVFLDTVFTTISSSTRSFKVYNRSNDNISIPTVSLARGEASFYRLNVNGRPGKSFVDVEIPSKDSIYIFVEATVDFEQVSDPLYTDEIRFESTSETQEVKLVTLVQDATFLFPERDADGMKETIVIGVDDEGEEIEVEGFYLDGSPVWTAEKPYVIYGFAGLRPGNSLTVSKGARVYFHSNSGLVIERGASLRVNGTREEKVIFQGDRLEEFYREIPGQWSGIILKEGSVDNRLDHTIIKNNTLGLLVDAPAEGASPGLRIENTEIYNTTGFGLFARSAKIHGANVVIGNNGSASMALTGGGDYKWTHCTLANFWSGGIRNLPAVIVSNTRLDGSAGGDSERGSAILAEFENCIIEGNQGIEFQLQKQEGSDFNFSFSNSLLRFEDPGGFYQGDPLYDFQDDNLYRNNIYNEEADFLDIELNDFRIGMDSRAIGIGSLLGAQEVPFDLSGEDRRNSPDAGAYQHLIREE